MGSSSPAMSTLLATLDPQEPIFNLQLNLWTWLSNAFFLQRAYSSSRLHNLHNSCRNSEEIQVFKGCQRQSSDKPPSCMTRSRPVWDSGLLHALSCSEVTLPICWNILKNGWSSAVHHVIVAWRCRKENLARCETSCLEEFPSCSCCYDAAGIDVTSWHPILHPSCVCSLMAIPCRPCILVCAMLCPEVPMSDVSRSLICSIV